MKRIANRNGFEVWAHFDRTAKVYELFASEDGGDYVGDADTLSQAQKYAEQWISERLSESRCY